jgi:phage head maturation protease
MTLVGYAVTFQLPAIIGGELEYIASTAFDTFLSRPHSVPLLFFGHDARTITERIDLSVDRFGLRLAARVEQEAWNGFVLAWRGLYNFCSIEMRDVRAERMKNTEGRVCNRIVSAGLVHVAVVDDRAAYQATGCWPTQAIRLPPRLTRLRQIFEESCGE